MTVVTLPNGTIITRALYPANMIDLWIREQLQDILFCAHELGLDWRQVQESPSLYAYVEMVEA